MYKRTEKLKAILKSLHKGASINSACQAANISVVSFWKWRKKNKKLDLLVKSIYDSRIQIVEDALYKGALEGNTTAQIFFLKNRAVDRWRDKQDVEHTGQGQNIVIIRPETKDVAGQVCVQPQEVSGPMVRVGNRENPRLNLAGHAIQRADTE